MVLHLNVALSEPGSGIVHQDGTPGQWCYTLMLHSMNLGVSGSVSRHQDGTPGQRCYT